VEENRKGTKKIGGVKARKKGQQNCYLDIEVNGSMDIR
jgi:hypothetical protein